MPLAAPVGPGAANPLVEDAAALESDDILQLRDEVGDRRDGRDRPTVRVREGDTVRWEWRSKESHQVSVREGPATFASPTKTQGGYERTFTEPGTYRLECSLHAPGMRMRVVVE